MVDRVAVVKLTVDSTGVTVGAAKASAALDTIGKRGYEMGQSVNKAGKRVTESIAAIGVVSVKMAGDFQAGMTTLVTGAGESESNIKAVSDGILAMSVSAGTSTKQLTDGMYMIESAGYHGADGLKVLTAAAQGAKVGNADLGTVANAVTSAMNSYGLAAGSAVSVTDQLVATTAAGKMKMQDLAGALGNVLPVAAKAGISLAEIGGAIATMTVQGMSADQASQNLANAIRSLQNPTAGQVKQMAAMGLQAGNLAKNLGKTGLVATLDLISTAILKHMGPDGLVLQKSLNQSRYAAQDANTMLLQLPKSLQGLARQFLNNQITAKQWAAELKTQPVLTANLGKQFAMAAKHANGFNDILKAGGPQAQTFAAALEKVMGSSTGLNVALMLGGKSAKVFAGNTAAVTSAGNLAGTAVTGWALVTQDFNFKLAQAKETIAKLGIQIGNFLIPIVESVAAFFSQWSGVLIPLGVALAGFLVTVFLVSKVVAGVKLAMELWKLATIAFQSVQFALNVILADSAAVTTAFGIAVKIATGPIGIITGVIALAAGAALLFSRRTTAEVKPLGEVTDALGKSRVAYLNDIKAKQLHATLTDENIALFQKAGISIDLVTAAVNGNANAQSVLNSILAAAIVRQTTYTTGQGRQGIASKQNIPIVSDLGNKYKDLSVVLASLNPQLQANARAYDWINNSAGKAAGSVVALMAASAGKSIASVSQGRRLSGKADGGPVAAGTTYLVGERGPETFVPNQSGTILPNGTGGSGSIVIHTHTYMDSRELRTTVQRYKARNGFTGLA